MKQKQKPETLLKKVADPKADQKLLENRRLYWHVIGWMADQIHRGRQDYSPKLPTN